MGVDYTAVLIVGKEFDSAEEAADFLRSHGIDVPDAESDEMQDGFEEWIAGTDRHGLQWERFNHYSSWDGGSLGWNPNVRNIEGFAEEVKGMQARWQDLFKETPEIIHAVKVW
jgi:hypothetical protein